MAGLPRRSLWIALVLLKVACPLRAQTPGPTLSAAQPTPVLPEPMIVPPQNGTSIYPSPSAGEVIVPPSSEAWCIPPQVPGRTSSWTVAVEFIPTRTRVTNPQFGVWDDDSSGAGRLILGYEDPEGLGIRARFWGLSQAAETPLEDVDLTMGKFDLDLYKRLFLERGELAFGAGPSSGSLEFKLSDDSHSEFTGTGGSLFVDGYYSLVDFEKSEIGAVARGRYTILFGDWRDSTGFIIAPTDNDTMSIAELAWGLEYRHRFGRCEDHSWFVGVLAEYQRWQSDWMARYAATSLGASGVNIYTGLNW